MLEPNTIIKRPIITEKSTWEASREIKQGDRAGQPVNRYAFVVDMRARKPHIRAAIESLYGVRVVKVATQVRKGTYFRNKFGQGKKPDWKKAVVQLHADDRIDLF